MATTYTQLASTFSYTDFSFKNYGLTDLAQDLVVTVDTTNYVADASTSIDSIGVAYPTLGGTVQPVIGVTLETIPAGGTGRVRCFGPIVRGTCHGAVTVGTYVEATVTAGKSGMIRTHTGLTSCGLALTSGADGDVIVYMLGVAPNA
jgi:hypothetical protein